MATTADLRNGAVLDYKGALMQVVEWQHVKPGKGGAFVRLKLKNLTTGKTLEDTVNAGISITIVRIERHTMQYLYRDGDSLIFMDNDTFNQIPVNAEMLGTNIRFLKENDPADLIFRGDTDELLMVELPLFVELLVTETATAVRGDTATDVSKPAILETGAEIDVPSFIKEGDTLKIDTRTGAYVSRV